MLVSVRSSKEFYEAVSKARNERRPIFSVSMPGKAEKLTGTLWTLSIGEPRTAQTELFPPAPKTP